MEKRHARRLLIIASLILISIVCFFHIAREAHWADLVLVRLNQLPFAVEYRVKQGSGLIVEEERTCRASSQQTIRKQPIPNVVHFIYLAQEGTVSQLTFPIFLAIKSALIRMRASEVKLHTFGLDTNNQWWAQLKEYVIHVEHDRYKIRTPADQDINGFAFAHQSDFLRLEILQREGGIYLDTDVYTLASFRDLLNNPRDTLLGHEGGNRYGLCNAVVLSRPDSMFIQKWQASYYSSFREHIWNEHSVRVPKRLAVQNPELICALSPTTFFWPTWASEHIEYMHEPLSSIEATDFRRTLTENNGSMFPEQLAYHAWGGGDGDFFSDLTYNIVLYNDTRFNILLRDILEAPLDQKRL